MKYNHPVKPARPDKMKEYGLGRFFHEMGDDHDEILPSHFNEQPGPEQNITVEQFETRNLP